MSENSKRFRIVKLTDAKDWPAHNNLPHLEKKKNKNWDEWRGKEIAIGEGVRPNTHSWKCDTKEVYPVTDETLARMGFSSESYGCTYVCEHQIQLPAKRGAGMSGNRAPQRIQRKRSKGWKMPEGAV